MEQTQCSGAVRRSEDGGARVMYKTKEGDKSDGLGGTRGRGRSSEQRPVDIFPRRFCYTNINGWGKKMVKDGIDWWT